MTSDQTEITVKQNGEVSKHHLGRMDSVGVRWPATEHADSHHIGISPGGPFGVSLSVNTFDSDDEKTYHGEALVRLLPYLAETDRGFEEIKAFLQGEIDPTTVQLTIGDNLSETTE